MSNNEVNYNEIKVIFETVDAIKALVLNHQQKINAMPNERDTIVINAFAGPGAGKTTSCLEIAEKLKKQGFVTEYVQEYAKELVWDNNLELLNGSMKNQLTILQEQLKRIDRLYGKVDFIVTDAPVLLNATYLSKQNTEYAKAVQQIYGQFDNFNYFVKRDASTFEQEGRIHTLEQSLQIDRQLQSTLDTLNLYYRTYTHSTIDKVVTDAIRYRAEKLLPKAVNNNDYKSLNNIVQTIIGRKITAENKGELLVAVKKYVDDVTFKNMNVYEKLAEIKKCNRIISELNKLPEANKNNVTKTQDVAHSAITKFTITPLQEPQSNVVAVASATFYDTYTVNSITICKGESGNLYVRMPQKRTNQGNYIDVTHPLNAGTRQDINNTLINAFSVGNFHQETPMTERPVISAQNSVKFPSGQYGNILGRMDIVVNDMVIHNCKMAVNRNSEIPKLLMPTYKDKHGEFHSIAVPANSDSFKAMNDAALSEYNAEYSFKSLDDSALSVLKDSGIKFTAHKNAQGENVVKFKTADLQKINAAISPAMPKPTQK